MKPFHRVARRIARIFVLLAFLPLLASEWTDLIGKAGFPKPASAAQSTPAPSPPQSAPAPPVPQSTTAGSLPEGFVLYKGPKEKFTIGIPKEWMAYDTAQAFKGALGRFGYIFFLPSKDFKSEAAKMQLTIDGKEVPMEGVRFMSDEVRRKVDTGETPSFFIQRAPADRGMSCTGFSEKAEKKLVEMIASDSIFGEGAKVLDPMHVDPAPVAGCKGFRIRGSGQPSADPPWVLDVYAASDGKTLYLFSLRNHAEYYDKNADVFQKAVSTAKLSAAK